jgi:NADH:ubiquinone reductase (H+-translocating)
MRSANRAKASAYTQVRVCNYGPVYMDRTPKSAHVPRIVVVGGGAGGLELAAKLGRRLGRRERAAITLIDPNLTHVWKPLLHEIAAGTLDSHEDDLDYLAQARKWHFRFRLGRMDGLDRDRRVVALAPITDESGNEIVPRRSFAYDYLVIAVGSVSNDFGVPGVEEYCSFLDTREQADRFQQQLMRSYLRAQTQSGPLKERQLSVAIVGGGATGVELAAELHHTARQLVAYGLDRIAPEQDVKLSLLEAGERILGALPERLSQAAAARLRALGVAVHTGQTVTRVTREGLETKSGLRVPAEMKVWAGGIKAPEFLRALPLETNRLNQLRVRRTLQTTLDDAVFAMGDCAECPQPGTDVPVPPRAQAAHQQASLLVKSFERLLKGQPALEYSYRDYGSLVSLSRYTTVGNLMGNLTGNVMIEGAFARLIYVSLYKSHRIAVLGRLPVLLESIANLITRPTRPRLKLH